MRLFVRASSLFVIVAPSIAAAEGPTEGRLDASFALGGHYFAEQGALGAGARPDDPGPDNSGLLGARVGFAATRRLAAEAELVVMPTQDDVLGTDATVYATRAHARFDLLTGRVRPFVVAGLGAHILRSSSPQLVNDTQAELHWGGGVRFAINPRFDLRFDVRHFIVADRTPDGITNDLEVTAGLGVKFGGKPAPKAVVRVAQAPAIGDADQDGILDNLDRCPNKAEDKDGFEDEDGCPDLDNDHDGVADTADKCPLEAETINGFRDSDGCPDDMISEIAGIGFEAHSARIDPTSSGALEKAYQLLIENPKLRVEISGHTSSEGEADKNQELSRWRAMAVKHWLMKKGISDDRIEAIGVGAAKPIAPNDTEANRIRNRRIEFRVLLPVTLGSR